MDNIPDLTPYEANRRAIELVRSMPRDCNPFEYLENLKKELQEKVNEDAYVRTTMKNQLAFFNCSYLLSQRLPAIPTKNYGQRYSSAPTSPLKVLDGPPAPKKGKMDENLMFSTSLAAGPLSLSRLDYIHIHLKSAIEYIKEVKLVEKAKDEIIQSKEPLSLMKTLVKSSSELLDMLVLEVEDKYWDVLEFSMETAAQLFNGYSELPGYTEAFSLANTGLGQLLDKVVTNLLGQKNENPLLSLKYGCSAQGLGRGILKSRKILGNLYLEKLCMGLIRIMKELKKGISGKKGDFIKYADLNAAFRILQVIEYLIGSSVEKADPWIEERVWKKLKTIERKAMLKLKLGHVTVYVSRVVNIAKKWVMFDSDSDSSDF